MTLKITPDESRPLDRGAFIQTRCPKSSISDEMIAARAKGDNLSNGDRVIVQCTTYDRDTVLYHREYLVYSRTSAQKVDDSNERSPRQFEEVTYGVIALMPWVETPAGKEWAEENTRLAARQVAEAAARAEKKKAA